MLVCSRLRFSCRLCGTRFVCSYRERGKMSLEHILRSQHSRGIAWLTLVVEFLASASTTSSLISSVAFHGFNFVIYLTEESSGLSLDRSLFFSYLSQSVNSLIKVLVNSIWEDNSIPNSNGARAYIRVQISLTADRSLYVSGRFVP